MGKTLIVSSASPAWRELTELTWPTFKAYADKWGYDFYASESEISAPARSPLYGEGVVGYLPIRGFVKLDLMLHFLDPESCKREYEWVVWLDADMLITNPEIPLTRWTECEEYYFNFRPRQLALPYDANGHNVTVIMAKNTQLVRDFLWACNNAGRTIYLRDDWGEMNAMRFFLQTPPYAGMAAYYSVKELCAMPDHTYGDYIPASTLQQYEWAPGDFAVHFSALDLSVRVAKAKEWLARIAPKIEIPETAVVGE